MNTVIVVAVVVIVSLFLRQPRITLTTIFLAACTPQQQPYIPDSATQPSLSKTQFTTADNVALPYRAWLPKSKPKAVIVALHGFNDYSHGFELAGEYFRKRGIALYAYDQRGFGASPQAGIWAGEENLTHDASAFTALIKQRHPRAPLFVMGESMGGAVAVLAASQNALPQVKGLILVAPALWGEGSMPMLYRGSSWLFAHTIPFYTLTGSDLKILATDNIPLLREMQRDPLVIKATRVDTVYGLVDTMNHGAAAVPLVHQPVLLLYGKRDEVIPPTAIQTAKDHFATALTYHEYPDGYHMLLRDTAREAVLEDISRWVDRFPPPERGRIKVGVK